jgi:ribosomal protein S24E
MEILKENQNNLLKRKEVLISLPSNSNPGFENSKRHLSEKFKTQVDNIAIKSVKNNFGANEFLVEAFLYDSLVDKERIEPKPKEKKKAQASGGG